MDFAGPSDGPHISPLPSSTKIRLRSTQILISLPQIVSELVQNSIDAGAHTVDVSIDPENWECHVRDDGAGIPRDGLALLASGPEERRYGTSKAYSSESLSEVSTFGFRGEALASLCDLCCLEISSRTKYSRDSWSVILKGEETLYVGPSIRWRRESPGTVVLVRDAFYNLPVRRRSHASPSRTIELVRREIEAYALMFPDICLSLENTRAAKEGTQVKSKTRLLTIPKTSSTLAKFRHLYGKALANHIETVDETRDHMKLEGFISLEGAYSKAFQFLYINKHPIDPCELHHAIANVFAHSSFGKHAYDESGPTSIPRSAARRSPRKTEKKAIYVLNLTIPPRFIDNTVEPAKAAVQLQNSSAAASFLASVVEAVLIRYGFLARMAQNPAHDHATPSPRKKRKLQHTRNVLPMNRSLSQPNPPSTHSCSVTRHGSVSVPTTSSLPTIHEDAAPNILWTDPATGEKFIIDSRTGNSYPQHTPAGIDGDTSVVPAFRTRKSLGVRDSGKGAEAPAPAWITEALQANNAYQLTECKIPALATSVDFLQQHACDHTHGADFTQRPSASWEASNFGRLNRDDLRAARVLGQVDRKFIACVIPISLESDLPDVAWTPGEGGVALTLIDQHAADERVRVERFLRELCEGFLSYDANPSAGEARQEGHHSGARLRVLEPPVHVLLMRVEAERIVSSRAVRQAFARWGVTFTEPPTSNGSASNQQGSDNMQSEYTQVTVSAIPEVVADKLLAEDELRDLIKGFLAKLNEDNAEGIRQLRTAEQGSSWQKALRWCPRELVELVNSKACRGAIMFNDSLTLEQCKALVLKLSETDLPFQCAHGRPSLVPLVETGSFVDSLRPRIDWSRLVGDRPGGE